MLHLNTIASFGRDEEAEAFSFGSEFLMPISEIENHLLKKLTIEKLADLKRVWKISMQAILKSANNNGFVDYNQSRYLWSQFNTLGIKKKEPIDIPKERPLLFKRILSVYMEGLNYNKEDLTGIFKLNPTEIESKFFADEIHPNKLRVA